MHDATSAAVLLATSHPPPSPSYVLELQPLRHAPQLALISTSTAASNDDTLALLDRSTLQYVTTVGAHAGHGVTCLRRNGGDDDTLLTAGRDGVVRAWDGRDGRRVLWELRAESGGSGAGGGGNSGRYAERA